jgi:hypothetical protein
MRKYPLLTSLIVSAIIGTLLISAASAGPIFQSKANVVTSPTGKMILAPSGSTQNVGCGNGDASVLNYVESPVIVKSSSVTKFPISSWVPYYPPHDPPFNKSIEMCASFDIPDTQTPPSDNTNTPSNPPTPAPTISPEPPALFFHPTPYSNSLKLSNFFSPGYKPLVPQTNPALFYPESSFAGDIAYERNFTDNQG